MKIGKAVKISKQEYVPVGRNLLLVDLFKTNTDRTYQKDITSIAHVISRRGLVPYRIVEGEGVVVPCCEIATNPMSRIGDGEVGKKLLEHKGRIAIGSCEDAQIMRLIDCAARPNQTVHYTGAMTLHALCEGFSKVEMHDLAVSNLVVNPEQIRFINSLKDFKPASKSQYKKTRLLGRLWTADVWTSLRTQPGTALVSASPEFVGIITAEKRGIRKLKCRNEKEIRKGYMMFARVGLCVMNDYAVAKVEKGTDPPLVLVQKQASKPVKKPTSRKKTDAS